MIKRNTIRTKDVLKVLRTKGYIKKWTNGKYRLMDNKVNPIRTLTRGQVDRLYRKQLIKDVDGIYYYKRPKDRNFLGLGFNNYSCTFDNWKSSFVIPGQTNKKAKALFYRQAKVTNPNLKYTDIRAKKVEQR